MNDQHAKRTFDLGIDTQTVMTLGSHCSLQVLKGAKDEGFNTLLVCEEKRFDLYKRFKFIDNIVSIKNFKEFVNKSFKNELIKKYKQILIPNETLFYKLNMDKGKNIRIKIFDKKWILRGKSNRIQKKKLRDK